MQPDWQGRGIGGRLLQMALDHCRQKGYHKIWLHTFSCLEQARRLYERFRFVLADSCGFNRWGDALVQERWELDIPVLPPAG